MDCKSRSGETSYTNDLAARSLPLAGSGANVRTRALSHPSVAHAVGIEPMRGQSLLASFAFLITALLLLVTLAGCGTPAASSLSPGEYTVEASLVGGSGKVTVTSPTKLTITADAMIAEVIWSSPYYTWMEVDGTRYEPKSQQGEDARFEIPVKLDTDIAVSAETVAMSTPHVIDYTLRFDSATVKSAA